MGFLFLEQAKRERKLYRIKNKRYNLLLRSCLVVYLILNSTSVVYPLPQVDNVENGDVNLDYSQPGTLTIVATDDAIVNYNSFDIADNEQVIFILPDSDSKILNRIIGQDATEIYGSLSANGIIFLINPNGITFEAGSSVNVAGIVASTNDLSSQDFLAQRYVFEKAIQQATSIINKGNIQVIQNNGYVVFISDAIVNEV